jgi:hypothetical protein
MTGRVFLLGAEFFARLTCGVEFRALTSFCFGSCKTAIPWPGPRIAWR